RPEAGFPPGIARPDPLQRDVFGNARAGDASRAVRSPCGFERSRSVFAAGMNAEAIAPRDDRARARGGFAFAAVIGARHMDAGLVQRLQRASGLLLPRPIAPANAFADGAAGAGEFEFAAPIRHRK